MWIFTSGEDNVQWGVEDVQRGLCMRELEKTNIYRSGPGDYM